MHSLFGFRIQGLHLCRGLRPPPNECPGYDTKPSDYEARMILELWGIWSNSSLPLLPGPLWARVVALERVPPMGQIELFDI